MALGIVGASIRSAPTGQRFLPFLGQMVRQSLAAFPSTAEGAMLSIEQFNANPNPNLLRRQPQARGNPGALVFLCLDSP